MRGRLGERLYAPRGNGLVQSDLGRDDPPPVAASKPPTKWEQRQRETAEMQTAMLNAWHQVAASLGGILDLAKAPPAGDVLDGGTRIIGPNGFLSVAWPSPFAAIHVANLSAATLTIAAGPPQQEAPQSRAGVFLLPGGIARTLSMRDTSVTVYGPPGSTFDITAYSRPRDPSSGLVDQGTSAGILVAPGTTTSTVASLNQLSAERLVVVLSVASVAGGSVTLVVNGVTPSGYVYPLLDPVAVTAAGVTAYRIGPGLTPSANAVANDVVPELVGVVATVAGTISYGIDFVAGR